jgi:hypothetical protein
LDDIIIYSVDLVSHCEIIKKILGILNKFNFKINIKKSLFFQKRMELLGQIIHGDETECKEISWHI